MGVLLYRGTTWSSLAPAVRAVHATSDSPAPERAARARHSLFAGRGSRLEAGRLPRTTLYWPMSDRVLWRYRGSGKSLLASREPHVAASLWPARRLTTP